LKFKRSKKTSILLITVLCLIIGGIFFLIQQNWILIHWRFDGSSQHLPAIKKEAISRKPIKLYFWKDEKFNTEDTTILWDENNTTHNLKQVILNWLTCNQEEKIIKPSTAFEGVVLSTFGAAYLSFNQSLLSKEWSIMKKWYLLESLFKTIRDAGITIQYTIFLVNHEAMDDDHIDFSEPLPINGFIKQ